MSVPVPGLKVTVDVEEPEECHETLTVPICDTLTFCSCQSEYCDCGSTLGVTEATASKIYQHFGFPNKRDDVISQGYRPDTLHIWGTHNLSTEDILSWLSDYSPKTIEWINDASCNVVFANENSVLRVIVDFAEPFDRRVALAAAAALVSLLKQNDDPADGDVEMKSDENEAIHDPQLEANGTESDSIQVINESEIKNGDPKSLTVSDGAVASIEQLSQYLPPTGRWYKALSVPSQAISLFLRFSHKSDVKQPGAERRSAYYRRFGNPNYGGMTGILTRSYRRRLRTSRQIATGDPNGDLRYIRLFPDNFAELVADAYEDPDSTFQTVLDSKNVPKTSPWVTGPTRPPPERPLIVYDNLYNDVEQKPRYENRAVAGQRRNAKEFLFLTQQGQPRKWPRRDRVSAPSRGFVFTSDDKMNGLTTTDGVDFIESPEPGSIVVIDPREPWGEEDLATDPKPFIFTGKPSVNYHRSTNRFNNSNKPIATVTLMPDTDTINGDSIRTRQPLTSMTMVADLETCQHKPRHVTDRLGFSNNWSASYSDTQPNRFNQKSRQKYHNSPNIWQRLG